VGWTRRAGADGLGRAGLRERARSEAPAHLGEEEFFFLFFNFFSRFSKGSSFKSNLEQENVIFWKWLKKKVA
jgi:hypothetical protein